MKEKLLEIYQKLYRAFGPQYWWPADSDFEVAVGAILTQNTSWSNVEKAIENLKRSRCLSFTKMRRLSEKKLAQLIRPAGYYNIKAKRLKIFFEFLWKNYRGSLKRMRLKETCALRTELLSVCGIGPETADSILLYALGKPIFVVDTYTRRIMSRHDVIKASYDYHDIQKVFMGHLRHDARIFNEYHALLVKCAKDFCKKHKMNCSTCPINHRGGHD